MSGHTFVSASDRRPILCRFARNARTIPEASTICPRPLATWDLLERSGQCTTPRREECTGTACVLAYVEAASLV
jgi:hypothetical protein